MRIYAGFTLSEVSCIMAGLGAYPSPPPHTNAVIMILTLKLIGLAFEVHDSEKETTDSTANDNLDSSKGDTSNLSKRRSSTVPSLEDQFHYGFNHVGLITGPYYKFSTRRAPPAILGTPQWFLVLAFAALPPGQG